MQEVHEGFEFVMRPHARRTLATPASIRDMGNANNASIAESPSWNPGDLLMSASEVESRGKRSFSSFLSPSSIRKRSRHELANEPLQSPSGQQSSDIPNNAEAPRSTSFSGPLSDRVSTAPSSSADDLRLGSVSIGLQPSSSSSTSLVRQKEPVQQPHTGWEVSFKGEDEPTLRSGTEFGVATSSTDLGVDLRTSLNAKLLDGTNATSLVNSTSAISPVARDQFISHSVARTSARLKSSQFEQLAQASRQSESQFDYWVQCCKAEKDNTKYIDAILCTMQEVLDETPPGIDIHPLQRTMLELSQYCEVLPTSLYKPDAKRYSTDGPDSGGGFADVYRGRLGEQEIALKRLRTFEVVHNSQFWKVLVREALVWRQLHHPHVLPFLGFFKGPSTEECYLLSPWMENGSISMYLQRHDKVDPSRKYSWIQQVADGLSYLHENDIVHGDLRGHRPQANILLDRNYEANLADYDITTAQTPPGNEGAARWSPPEVLKGGRCQAAGDVYSFACVCLEIVTQAPPFAETKNDNQVIFDIRKGARLGWREIGDAALDGLSRIVTPAWAENPSERPSMRLLKDSLVSSSAVLTLADSS
ncbi:hypothetical protein NM688_g1299 [Phlebia brevispora]|uniref:Uncharacterized protein n=1 Tax=Phlebia brevispora TaxID=194682 RepID=A0ACC1TBV7_9APHY|nr:hypothetical protein NM688_g1299 [Phlebia brevispora]